VSSRAIVTDRIPYWVLAGLVLGLTALTKAEIALAAASTAAVAWLWRLSDGRPGMARHLVAFVAGLLAPLGICWLVLGAEAITAPWLAVARVVGGEHTFNAHLIGTDDLLGNLSRLAVDSLAWTLLTCMVIGLDLYCAGAQGARRRWSIIGGSAIAGLALVRDLPAAGRPLPVLIPIAAAVLVWLAHRHASNRDRFGPLILWATAAWSLLGRMILNVHLHHYGFYLALPAAIFVVVLSVGVVPRLLAERVPGGGGIVRGVALVTIGLLVLYSTALSVSSNARMTIPIGRDGDAMYGPSPDASPTGMLAAALLERIDSTVPRDATLAVLPDGTMLNFLSRRPNPTSFNQMMPPTLVTFGVDTVLASYQEHSPEYVVLYDWSGAEYGVGTFGSGDWGREVVDWVRQRYDAISFASSSTAGIGFSIWKRREPPVGDHREASNSRTSTSHP
jgi:hypothetical protein